MAKSKGKFFSRRGGTNVRPASSIEDVFSRRAFVAGSAAGAIWLGLIGRFYQLQIMEGEEYRQFAEENRVRLDLAPPQRGEIVDRFGQPLASHRSAGRVSVVREQAGDVRAVLAEIGELIDLPEEMQARIAREAARQAAFVPVVVKRELTYEDFARMKLHAAGLPGVQVEMGHTRSYPRGRDFAHVLGYVARASQPDLVRFNTDAVWGKLTPEQQLRLALEVPVAWDKLTDTQKAQTARPLDGSLSALQVQERLPVGSELRAFWDIERERINRLYRHPDMRAGRSGLERVADTWLTGKPGSNRMVTNAAGRIIEQLDSRDLAPEPGRNVTITIDADLQRAAIERFGQESGAAVVMDIESGAILALVSTPAFDPNDFVNGISQADYDVLRSNDRSPLYHKAFDGVYPPGSTFKMVVATAALEAEVIDPRERIYCSGRYRFGNRTWSCWKQGGHGSMDMHEGIKQSCDTYFYEIAQRMGIEKLAETARAFGFGSTWQIGLTGGATGVVPDDAWKRAARGEPWYEGETLNIGIGQGYMSSTPLQLAVMTARIARGGGVLRPRLIEDGPDVGPTDPDAPIDHQRPLDPAHMERMRAAMFGVTSEWGGTARRAGDLGVNGYLMAGKTGTAQVRYISQAERARGVISNENLERRLRDHALFVGYAPHDAPRYAISVIVEHGGGGSSAAAPVARDIMAEALRRGSGAPPIRQAGAGEPDGSGAG